MGSRNNMNRIILALSLLIPIPAFADSPALYLDVDAPIEQRVEDALSRMTLEEKVDMCHGHSKFTSAGVPRLGIPQIWWSDGPHGVRAEFLADKYIYDDRLDDFATAFPALTALAATWNPELAMEYGKALGDEALYRGKTVMLGPGLNICRTPLNGRNFEYMGEDPMLCGEMAVPYIQGMQSRGVAACVKHFALNNQEKWRLDIDVNCSERALNEIYLPAFKKAVVEGGAWVLMGGYNRVAGEHASHNKHLLCDILRDRWKYDGVVVSDWGGAHDTFQSANNGLDVEMGTSSPYNTNLLGDNYLEAMRSGLIDPATVDTKVRNILRLIFRTSMSGKRGFGSMCTLSHYDLCRRIGTESIVLLKNNGILPLEPAQRRRILVVGENAVLPLNEAGGSSELKVKDMYSPLDALRDVYGSDVKYAAGYKSGAYTYNVENPVPQAVTDSLHREAVDMAREADVVIYIGGLNKNSYQDCENRDRYTYNLIFGQDSLINALADVNPNIIVANISGAPYAMPWLEKVPAVIQSWYLGTMIGPSMADVIAGRVNPSGKLPFSFPREIDDCGAHAMGEVSYPGVEDADGRHHQEYLDDILVGYRWYDTKKIPAMFPFGYGLSYTSFKYGIPSLRKEGEDWIVTVAVSNTGKTDGKETVQLYVSDVKSKIARPEKELKAFSKVDLKPGETKTVELTLRPDDMKYYDPDSGDWVLEPGKFRLLIGTSSKEILQKLDLEI